MFLKTNGLVAKLCRRGFNFDLAALFDFLTPPLGHRLLFAPELFFGVEEDCFLLPLLSKDEELLEELEDDELLEEVDDEDEDEPRGELAGEEAP